MEALPEFKVTLTRLTPGETAYPQGDGVPRYEILGQRTKLGGLPDWEQGRRALPKCMQCKNTMVFVAQIDSVEHYWDSNPHAVKKNQKWMFGDVGLIYVFFCFDCLTPHSEFEGG